MVLYAPCSLYTCVIFICNKVILTLHTYCKGPPLLKDRVRVTVRHAFFNMIPLRHDDGPDSNRVPASAVVKADKSPLPCDRSHTSTAYVCGLCDPTQTTVVTISNIICELTVDTFAMIEQAIRKCDRNVGTR